jgi:hypothetical protein
VGKVEEVFAERNSLEELKSKSVVTQGLETDGMELMEDKRWKYSRDKVLTAFTLRYHRPFLDLVHSFARQVQLSTSRPT